jgi:hypothetical protein
MSIGTALKNIEAVRAFFLPNRSPICPKKAAPKGLEIKETEKAPNPHKRDTTSSWDGKKTLERMDANMPNKTKL